jgi:hypothetical protein
VPGTPGSYSQRLDTSVLDTFAVFASKNLESARLAAESVTGEMRWQAFAGVGKAWGQIDGTSALAWAQSLPTGEIRGKSYMQS